MEAGQLVRAEDAERPFDGVQPDTGQRVEELFPGIGQPAFDDPTVIGSVAPLDQVVSLDPGDETGHGRGAEAEHLGDPTHRLGAFPAEEEEQPDLAEGQVGGRPGRHGARDVPEDAQEIQRRGGQRIVRVS